MKNNWVFLCGLLGILAWAALAPPARAQFICHVTAKPEVGKNQYWYSALSCKGNNCLAMGISELIDSFPWDLHLIFLRSVDGGNTWAVQDSFPVWNVWYQQPNLSAFVPIDSLNILAFGRSDSIYRTSDGGVTWQQETIPSTRHIVDVSFSTSMDGFLIVADTVDTILTTSDGGIHWKAVPLPFQPLGGVAQCHDYGQGKYRLFSYYYGQIYTTTNNWKTVDSTGPIISDPNMAIKYGFGHCAFESGDTILAYGNYFNFLNHAFPLISRTTNGGHDWTLVYSDTSVYGSIHALSDINRDTILAAISGNSTILLSTDHGVIWQIDTLVSTDAGFDPLFNDGIELASNGNLIAAYGSPVFSSSIIVGYPTTSTVRATHKAYEELIYPNPARTSIALSGLVAGQSVHLLDILGREVLCATIPPSATISLDVSRLPRGMYMVILDHDGDMIPAGRVILN